MPYRIDLPNPPHHALDRLVQLGALDVESASGGLAALLPDAVTRAALARALGGSSFRVTAARGRDDGSVWVLAPRPVHVGGVEILPASWPAQGDALRLVDSDAFGTGLHPTTALCLEILAEEAAAARPATMLDVGTGSGVLALAALRHGVTHVTAIDIDELALETTAANARMNGLEPRLTVARGGPGVLSGSWPFVVANILAAPLMEMAPALTPRLGSGGRLVLSGIPESMAVDVERIYVRLGMKRVRTDTREGWAASILRASW